MLWSCERVRTTLSIMAPKTSNLFAFLLSFFLLLLFVSSQAGIAEAKCHHRKILCLDRFSHPFHREVDPVLSPPPPTEVAPVLPPHPTEESEVAPAPFGLLFLIFFFLFYLVWPKSPVIIHHLNHPEENSHKQCLLPTRNPEEVINITCQVCKKNSQDYFKIPN